MTEMEVEFDEQSEEEWRILENGKTYPDTSETLQNGEIEPPISQRGGYRPQRGGYRPKRGRGRHNWTSVKRKQLLNKQKSSPAVISDDSNSPAFAPPETPLQQHEHHQKPLHQHQQYQAPIQHQQQYQAPLQYQYQQSLQQQPRKRGRPKLNPKFVSAEPSISASTGVSFTGSSMGAPPPKSCKRGRPKLNPKFAANTGHHSHLSENGPIQSSDNSANGPMQNSEFSESSSVVAIRRTKKPKMNFKKSSKSSDLGQGQRSRPDLDPFLIAKDAKQLTKAARRMVRQFQWNLHYRWRVSATEYGLIIHVERGDEGVKIQKEEKVAEEVALMDEMLGEKVEKVEAEAEEAMALQEFDWEEEEEEDGDEAEANGDEGGEGKEMNENHEQFLTSGDEGSRDAMRKRSTKKGAQHDDVVSGAREPYPDEESLIEVGGSRATPNPEVESVIKEEPENEDFLLAMIPNVREEVQSGKHTEKQKNKTLVLTKKDLTNLDAAPPPENFKTGDAASASDEVAPDDATLSPKPPSKPAPPAIVLPGDHCVALSRLAPRILAYLDDCSSASSSNPISLHAKDLLYECRWCRRNFKCRSSLIFHKSQSHNPITADEFKMLNRIGTKKPSQTSDSASYRAKNDMKFPCSLCKDIFSVEVDLRHHFYDHRVCWVCGQNFSSVFSTIKHESKAHGLDRALPEKSDESVFDSTFTRRRCQFCSTTCKIPIGKYPRSFARHLESHRITGDSVRDAEIESILDLYPRQQLKGKPSYSCISCGESYPTSAEVTEHKKVHKTCPECLLEVPHIKDLPHHIRDAHGQTADALNDTLLKTGLKQHLCQVCGRVFATKKRLVSHHERAHPKERVEAECEKCGKKCADMAALKRHLNSVHSTARRFVCQECGKAFKSAGNRHQHKQQHKPRKFICGCGHAFTYKHGLQNHQVRCFAGLPCKQPHTKNRPQKDEFGQIIPLKKPTQQEAPAQAAPPPQPELTTSSHENSLQEIPTAGTFIPETIPNFVPSLNPTFQMGIIEMAASQSYPTPPLNPQTLQPPPPPFHPYHNVAPPYVPR